MHVTAILLSGFLPARRLFYFSPLVSYIPQIRLAALAEPQARNPPATRRGVRNLTNVG